MKQNLSLDDFALFVAVADASGLAGAARKTGISVPTLSRRMSEFEQRLGQRLFVRGARGYALTARGRALLQEAEQLRAVAAGLAAFAANDACARVRVTAGEWTSRFLAQNINRYWSSDCGWVPEFVVCDAAIDVARREADIGIRNKRPEQSWLAGRRTGCVDYAAFAVSGDVTGYIVLPEAEVRTRSGRWLWTHHAEEIVTTANHVRLALDLALAGVGRILLPLFAARAYPQLCRVGPVIEELRHEEWLVCHHEARHDPPIRAALEAIGGLLSDRTLRAAEAASP